MSVRPIHLPASYRLHRLRPRFWVDVIVGVLAVGVAAMAFGVRPAAAAEAPVGLGTAASFGVLAGSAVTNTGPSVINGDLGVSPGTAVTGFPPGVLHGTSHSADSVALQAKSDLVVAYNDAAGRASTATVSADLGGQSLVPGVYTGTTLSLTGTLTLNGQGDPNAVFIFRSASTLITASASRVVLINFASPCNVYWQVASSATLGTSSVFVGTTMALASITATTGATVAGRLLARNAAVTLDSNVITRPSCAAGTTTPTTTGLTPTSGSTGGGTTVTVTGTGFVAGGTSVTIGGVVLSAAQVKVASPSSLSFLTPAHAAGPVNVTVTTPAGTSGPLVFKYVSGTPAPGPGAPHTGEPGTVNPLNGLIGLLLLGAGTGVAFGLRRRTRRTQSPADGATNVCHHGW
jgi:hypothetical protein